MPASPVLSTHSPCPYGKAMVASMVVLFSLHMAACNGGTTSDNATQNGSADTGDSTNTTTDGAASSLSLTGDVLCDYSDVTPNNQDSLTYTSTSQWTCPGTTRDLIANGIPDHAIGTFPNPGNPNTIVEQDVAASFTLNPVETDNATELGGPAGVIAFVLNGVKVDPGTGGSCNDSGDYCSLGDPSGNWSIEALGQSSFDFGEDFNNAHVQPDGTYHYHGMPEAFIEKRGGSRSDLTLIAWAADGFPIYARYGYADPYDASSDIVTMQGSYALIEEVPASRPSTEDYPLGTFRQDWMYVAGSGDLDECNGRFGVTPEFPQGIYHYYATDS